MKDTSDTLKVVIHPLRGEDAYLTASEFVRSVSAYKDTFKKLLDTEVCVIGLSCNSPVAITFGEPNSSAHVLSNFYLGLEEIAADKPPPLDWNRDVIDEISNILSPVGNSIGKYVVTSGGKNITLDVVFKKQFSDTLQPDSSSEGTVDGMLEAVNIHGKSNVLTLYPPIGQIKVACHFPDDKLDDIKNLIGKYVEVTGRLKHRWREKYPYEVKVSNIEVIDEENLPTFSQLLGLSPNATKGVASEDFIAGVRSEWN